MTATADTTTAAADTSGPIIVDLRPMTALERLRRAALQMPAWVVPDAVATALALRIPEFGQMLSAAGDGAFDLYHAHDAEALLVASVLARRRGAKLIYDSHEYGQGARLESLSWRLAFPAFIRAIERRCMPQAAAVITVSDYLADALQKSYGLREKPAVIRNLPYYQAVARKPSRAGDVLILYHGILNSGRGLEIVIEALARLPGRFRLRLTGPVRQPGYDAALRRLADALGVAGRVAFHDAVPSADLIAHASEADIGIYVTRGQGIQERAALPNKIFEYAMAGLAVVGGPAPGVVDFIERNRLGVAVTDVTPEALAARLLAMTPADLATWQANALAAAKVDNWEAEERKLLAVYERAGAGGAVPGR